MTEEERWVTSDDRGEVPPLLCGLVSSRKLQLLTVASCNLIWPVLTTAGQSATIALEEFADNSIDEATYRQAWGMADVASRMLAQDPPDVAVYAIESALISIPPTVPSVKYALSTASIAAAMYAADQYGRQDYDHAYDVHWRRAIGERGALIRDIFGSTTAQPGFHPSWRTEAVFALARGMYESRDFGPMPVLADALEDAGCADPDVLAHCRGDGPHVRGCWVVDLVLGKE
jgi:hypothetical protein